MPTLDGASDAEVDIPRLAEHHLWEPVSNVSQIQLVTLLMNVERCGDQRHDRYVSGGVAGSAALPWSIMRRTALHSCVLNQIQWGLVTLNHSPSRDP
jgi:hypothetical protein